MFTKDMLKNLSIRCLILTLTGAVFFIAASAWAQSEGELNIDLNRSNPVKLQATIMEIDAAKGILIVAEKEILIVDLNIDGYPFKTELQNLEGRLVPFESFQAGQRVYVEGIEFEKYRVAASLIKHMSPIQAQRQLRN